MTRLVEVAGHLERQPATLGAAVLRNRRQQAAVVRHPVQRGVADKHVDRRGRTPITKVCEDELGRGSLVRSRALAIISGDESTPTTVASGQRSASDAVSWPGPQPRSTTIEGALGSDPGYEVEERSRPLVAEPQVGQPDPSWPSLLFLGSSDARML